MRAVIAILALATTPVWMTSLSAFADDPPAPSWETTADHAKAAWENGATNRAIEILDQGLLDHPRASTLHKLRGDILTVSRRPQEAVTAYEAVLTENPDALNVRWAKWSVLVRSGQGEDAIGELRHIAAIDPRNPLVHLRLALELRKLDRLEESLESLKKAVDLAPEMLGWRLTLSRARFDVLDYDGANRDVDYVLDKMPPCSPLELPANTLSTVYHGYSQERGRRFNPVFTPKDITSEQLKEWALMRAKAWELFSAGRYQEAEPMYRKLLALNPRDPTATHQLGLTLMQLGKCKEALTVFRKVSDLDPTDDQYSDTVFNMGRCLMELEQWEDAFVHFQILYEEAVQFEAKTKDTPLPPGTRVPDKKKLARWIEKVRPHVPELAKLHDEQPAAPLPSEPPPSPGPSKEELASVLDRLKPENALDTRGSLVGRDADFSWFRFVIPAGKVMRDDLPTGQHDFVPLNPGDSFPMMQQELYLVFALVSASYDAVPLAAQCTLETSEMTGEPRTVVQDRVMMAMNDQSGYFMLPPPKTGWSPGIYRCGLYAGERTSADTQVDEVRFRIIKSSR